MVKRFQCAPGGLVSAQAFLESVCGSPKAAIALDEIASNIVRYSGASGFELSIGVDGDALTMEFSDDGVAFDPTKEAAVPDTSASTADRPIGGLGIFMVKKMSKSVTYRRLGGKNVLTVVMEITRG